MRQPTRSPINHSNQSFAHLRLRVYLSFQEPIISKLISEYGLAVNVTRAVLENEGFPRQFDLELYGSIAQIQAGLSYLTAVSLAIQGKPNPDGDSWHY